MITGDNAWQYFGQIKYVQPILTSPPSMPEGHGGLPARRFNRRGGGHYLQQLVSRWSVRQNRASAASYRIAPRARQRRRRQIPDNTGYDRVFISPGIDITKVIDEANNRTFKLYGDIEIPVYQRVNGNQLVAPYQAKIVAGYTF